MKYNVKVCLAYFAECGLPSPIPEFQFAKDIGRKWRFDWAFIVPSSGIKLALEIEGAVWIGHTKKGLGSHARPKHFVKDMEKYNYAACLGWYVLRVEPKNLCTQDTISMIKQVLDLPDRLQPRFRPILSHTHD